MKSLVNRLLGIAKYKYGNIGNSHHIFKIISVPISHSPRWRQWCVIKKHSVTNPNAGVFFNVICSSSGGRTSLVSLSSPTTCKAVFSSPIASLLMVTAQYLGSIFKSLGEEGSVNGWHNLRRRVLRLRKNPSCAWDVAKNSAIICKEKRKIVAQNWRAFSRTMQITEMNNLLPLDTGSLWSDEELWC